MRVVPLIIFLDDFHEAKEHIIVSDIPWLGDPLVSGRSSRANTQPEVPSRIEKVT